MCKVVLTDQILRHIIKLNKNTIVLNLNLKLKDK